MPRIFIAAALLLGLTAGTASAQTSPAFGPLPDSTLDMPLADYLGLLRQIAPAAESGARTYLAAVRLRCGRTLTTADLRQAVADSEGNPALMGLIRAAHQQDTAARNRLVAQLPCPIGGAQ
jgi:hypothetical protein